MFAWVKRKALALIVATLMFAVMAAVMAGFLSTDSFFETLFGEGASGQGMLWTWRIGGLLTWPTFMLLMLRPYMGTGEGDRQVLVRTLVVAALYGGGGLWLISEVWKLLVGLDDQLAALVMPFVALASLGLPYLYTWGFVAIYGLARDGMANRADHGWMPSSLGATVLGIYGIGALAYMAIAVVSIPVAVVIGMVPGEAGLRLSLALFAIALSTGNFASQWYAFYRVDSWFEDDENRKEQVAQPQPQPQPQPTAPANAPMPDGNVILPDGRLVTPDGRVYVPQAPRTHAAPAVPSPAASTGGGEDPYALDSKGQPRIE